MEATLSKRSNLFKHASQAIKHNEGSRAVRQLGMFDNCGSIENQGSEVESTARPVDEEGAKRNELVEKASKKKKRKATSDGLMELLNKQDMRCALSGIELTIDTSRLDHIVPVSAGGEDCIENLQWVHADVNRAKGVLSQSEFIKLCKRVAAYQG